MPTHRLLLALTLWSLSCLCPAAERLNVIFILADDLGWGELGCYGQKKIPTPNIDRLAQGGMRFTQHYSGAPVCAPSRCVLMTGRHLGHAEVRGNRQAKATDPRWTEGQHPLSESAVTVAQQFQKAGYATGAMGKWGLGPVGSTGDPAKKGIEYFFGYNCQSIAHSYYPPYLWRNAQQVPINAKPVSGHTPALKPEQPVVMEDYLGTTYASSLMEDEAVGFLERNQSKPFFLYLPFIEPHVAMHPPKETVERFPKEWDTEPYRGDSGYLPHPRPHAGYAAMIAQLDQHVGKVLDKLDALHLAERTLVIFSSDNGTTHAGPAGTRFHVGGADPAFFNSTAGLRGYKGSVYEGGIRVPMLARLPGRIPAGTVSDRPGYFADWFPTLCAAAGLEIPAGHALDGESLWPVMTGQDKSSQRERPMIWVFPEYGGQVAVRLGDYKLVRQNLQPRGKKAKSKDQGSKDWQVYNLAKDPGETTDLAKDSAAIIAEATALLQREVAENKAFPLALP